MGHAASVSLAWNPSTSSGVSGYNLYSGFQSRTYGTPVSAGSQTTYTYSSLVAGKSHYFAVTAFDSSGRESGYSSELICHTISSSVSSGGGGTVSPSGVVPVSDGGSKVFTFTPSSGYRVLDVKVDGTSVGAVGTYTFSTVSSPHTVEAVFGASTPTTYTISSSAGTNGTISPSGKVSVNAGATQAFTITPASGYRVLDVTVDGTSVGAVDTYTFSNVQAGHTISAAFAQSSYTITASSGANGTISPSGSVSVSAGSTKAFTITPTAGYQVDSVSVDGVSKGSLSSYTFSNIASSHTISASFKKTTYTINSSSGANGSISPTGSVPVDQGSDATFTISANKGYQIKDVLVDGASVGSLNSYKFESVQKDHTISASFAPFNQKPTADAGPDQKVKSGSRVVLSGANSTDPDDGISSFRWTQTGGAQVTLSSATSATPTFTAPSAGSTGEALTFTLTVADKAGQQSTDTSIVNVLGTAQPPTASAGAGTTAKQGDAVSLDGSKSSDPSGAPLSYSWEQIKGTPVTVQNSATSKPTFTAPTGSARDESLAFRLTVTSSSGLKARDVCIVNVRTPLSTDLPPTASAGADQSNVSPGDSVTLSGTQSSDPNDSISSFRWTQLSGEPVALSDPTAPLPTFTAPDAAAEGASLGFMLTVTDQFGLSASARSTVQVMGAGLPDLTGAWSSLSYVRNKLSAKLQIKNTGSSKAGSFVVKFALSNGTVLQSYTVQSLGSGQSAEISFSYSKPRLSGVKLIATLDSAKAVSESDKSNNIIISLIP